MQNKAKLPIGIENFEEIRTEGFYYVDKTGLIKELLDNWPSAILRFEKEGQRPVFPLLLEVNNSHLSPH